MNAKMSTRNIIDLLQKIEEGINQLTNKVDFLIKAQKSGLKNIGEEYERVRDVINSPLDVVVLLSLPDHLRKTAMTMCELRRATAKEVSEKTRRMRATESSYLNQLVRMGYLQKERGGLEVYFILRE